VDSESQRGTKNVKRNELSVTPEESVRSASNILVIAHNLAKVVDPLRLHSHGIWAINVDELSSIQQEAARSPIRDVATDDLAEVVDAVRFRASGSRHVDDCELTASTTKSVHCPVDIAEPSNDLTPIVDPVRKGLRGFRHVERRQGLRGRAVANE